MKSSRYFAKETRRKFGRHEKLLIQIFEQAFPYPLDSFLAENNSFENWLTTQNKKSDEVKIFEKIVILFKQKREIEYGIFLAMERDAVILKNFDLGKSIQEITTIAFMIPMLYEAIKYNFLEILKSQKAKFEADIEFHLYYDLEYFPNDYQKIQNSISKSINSIA